MMLLVAAAAGAFVFVFELLAVHGARLAPGDAGAFDVVRHLRTAGGVHVARVLTWLGAAPVAWPIVAVVARTLARRGRRREALGLAVGLVLTVVLVHVIKAAVDRPRPSRPLTTTHDRSFPSGHTAYATAVLAAAVAGARIAPAVWRGAMVAAGLAVTVVVGLTRIYLRAHYLSDVLAGAGLTAALFALCGSVALIVDAVRHNGER